MGGMLHCTKNKYNMRVRIVCHNNCFQWILGKFVNKLYENLQKYDVDVDIAERPDATADVNHFIPYNAYECSSEGITTLMLTHIDNNDKLEYIIAQSKKASALVCMSNEAMTNLSKMGVDNNKLCYINPAHDEIMPVKKIVIGTSCRVQEDGRKREFFIDKLAKKINPLYFHFKIMGDSWDSQVENLKKYGFEVDYINKFIYAEYPQFISSLDYYLYMGMDEGQMGFIDALAAGVKTIVTAQGYHLDAPNGISHSFKTYEELEYILLQLEKEKEVLVNSVSNWKWKDYTMKHIEIWNYLIDNTSICTNYSDGLNSLLASKNNITKIDKKFQKKKIVELKREGYKHKYFALKRKVKSIISDKGFFGLSKKIIFKLLKNKTFNQNK